MPFELPNLHDRSKLPRMLLKNLKSFATAFAAVLTCVNAVPTPEIVDSVEGLKQLLGLQARQDDKHWVATWASMPQLVEPNNLPPAPYVRPLNPAPLLTRTNPNKPPSRTAVVPNSEAQPSAKPST